jgi:hypothetical protein
MGLGDGNASGTSSGQRQKGGQNPEPAPPTVKQCKPYRIVLKFIQEKTNKEIAGVEASVEQTKGTPVDMPASSDKGISKVVTGDSQNFRVIQAEAEVLYEVISEGQQAIPENT